MNWGVEKADGEKESDALVFTREIIGGSLILSSMCMRGTDLEDFIAGVMTGVGCGSILVGVYVISRTFRK
ncbi:MAG: hypothetical protein K1W36_05305 [Lachnospiraceae bacterium]|jgi:Na+-transporting NADH:ubiquinone oxidoreductase subunit NqrD|nr:hypothetical protein [Lachnospiraceae bacterium]